MKEKKRKTQAASRKENEIDDTQAMKETYSDVNKLSLSFSLFLELAERAKRAESVELAF